MRLWIEGSPYDPESFEIQNIVGENLSHLEPVAEFLRFWFSEKKEWPTYTSGSTSDPKVIRLSRAHMEESARLHMNYFNHDPQKVGFVLCISARHVGGFMILVRALIADIDVLILPPTSNPIPPDGLPPFLKWFISMVPMQFYRLLERDNLTIESMNWAGILLGGAPISDHISSAITSLSIPVFHSYGMTETISHIAVRKIHPTVNQQFTKIGFDVLPGIEIRLNENSCLAICGLVTGNVWIQTNDEAVLLSSSQFLLLGRTDQIINSGGIKIHPDSVSSLVISLLPKTHPGFEVLGLPDTSLGQRVVLVFFSDDLEKFRLFWDNLHWEKKTMNITDPVKRRILPKAVFILPSRPTTASQKPDVLTIRKIVMAIKPFWEKSEMPY